MVAERLAIKAGNTRAQVWHATHATAQDARALTKRGEESNIVIGARPLVSPLYRDIALNRALSPLPPFPGHFFFPLSLLHVSRISRAVPSPLPSHVNRVKWTARRPSIWRGDSRITIWFNKIIKRGERGDWWRARLGKLDGITERKRRNADFEGLMKPSRGMRATRLIESESTVVGKHDSARLSLIALEIELEGASARQFCRKLVSNLSRPSITRSLSPRRMKESV